MEAMFVTRYETLGFRRQQEAARLAGYKCAKAAAIAILKRPAVQAAIKKRRQAMIEVVRAKGLLDRDKLLQLWSELALKPSVADRDRLAASKLLAEYLGMFDKDNQDNVPRTLLQILKLAEGRCPRCGEIVRIQPVEVLVEQPPKGIM